MTTQQSFTCDFPGCGLSYRRKEHLTRHAKRHTQPQSFPCPFCDRSFSRNDTLRQHARATHKNKEIKTSRTTKACNYCRSRRSKCNGHIPCEACSSREIDCSYARGSRGRSKVQRHEDTDHQISPLLSGEPDYLSPSHFLPTEMIPDEPLEKTKSTPYPLAPCIKAYFDNFHPHWPFLHAKTFKSDHESSFLVQSVAMMGLWTMRDSKSQGIARQLHETLSAAIYDQRHKWDISDQDGSESQLHEILSPGPAPWPMATYQGILIQLIFSLLTHEAPADIQMTRNLPEVPSQLLVGLVRTCFKREMFYYPSMLAQFKTETSSGDSMWIGIEGVKRFNLSLYKVCRNTRPNEFNMLEDSFSSENRRGRRSPGESLLSLADLQFALPIDEELFDSDENLTGSNRILEGYKDQNMEQLWLSQAAKVVQPRVRQFQWI